jgi:putative endonuclease
MISHVGSFNVYIIVSLSNPDRYYIGVSTNVDERLSVHNCGNNPSTAPFIPWSIAAVVSFPSKDKALDFERYLKGGSGRAFLKKHLL